MIETCPLKINQKIFELQRRPGPKWITPSIVAWTVVDITRSSFPDWSAIISHQTEDEDNPHTRTILLESWETLYHPNTASAVRMELHRNRTLIKEFYATIDSLKQYIYAVEGLGLLINNNNKQDNPLEIDIF